MNIILFKESYVIHEGFLSSGIFFSITSVKKLKVEEEFRVGWQSKRF